MPCCALAPVRANKSVVTTTRISVICLMYLLTVTSSARAEEFHVSVGESIQTVMNDAMPGDTIILETGTHEADLSTESDGEPSEPITLKGDGEGEVVVTSEGEVLQIDHSHWRIEGLILDGQYGSADTLDINDGAHFLVVNNVEVRRSGRDCVDMGDPSYVQIENSRIHHCLHYDEDSEEAEEAHGITGGAVQNLNIIDTLPIPGLNGSRHLL